jgi:hypothetical protein
MDVRRRYLSGMADVDPVNDLRRWRSTIADESAYGELVLWYEHDLFDQVNLIQLLPWIRATLSPSKVVSLICIGSFPGRPRFKGLGELTPDELASLIETRQRVGDDQYALAARAWDAFRQPAPDALDALRQADTSALPYLGGAVTRFLQEYPWTRDGLSRSERRLLDLASDGPVELMKVFSHMSDGEDAYYITDLSLSGLAETLSHTSPPLLSGHGTHAPDAHPLRRSVEITGAGRAVLAGQADRVALTGIDRWLGGVHLVGHEAECRWDDAAGRIVRTRG